MWSHRGKKMLPSKANHLMHIGNQSRSIDKMMVLFSFIISSVALVFTLSYALFMIAMCENRETTRACPMRRRPGRLREHVVREARREQARASAERFRAHGYVRARVTRAALLIALVCATPVSVSPRIVRATPQGL